MSVGNEGSSSCEPRGLLHINSNQGMARSSDCDCEEEQSKPKPKIMQY